MFKHFFYYSLYKIKILVLKLKIYIESEKLSVKLTIKDNQVTSEDLLIFGIYNHLL